MTSRARAGLALAGLALAASLALGYAEGRRTAEDAPDVERWRPLVERIAAEADVEAALLLALVAAESGGDPRAVSRAGARGLVQLMPATAEDEARRHGLPVPTPESLFDPATNLGLGARTLRRLLDRYGGEVAFAIAAYNAGPTRVDRWRARAMDVAARDVIEREGFGETRRHLARVLAWRSAYSR